MSDRLYALAPSFRRGPPKGYIQALEHRLHQVESVLAAIMSCQDARIQAIVDELSQDELAAYVLETVDTGPFVRIIHSYMRVHSDLCFDHHNRGGPGERRRR